MVVWDLFGGGCNSVYNALKDNSQFIVYTFDITEPTRQNHIKLDLSQDNIVDKFTSFPKPDIIVASPLCNSFSAVLAMKGGGTCFWKLNETKDQLVLRPIDEFERLKSGFTKNLNAQEQLRVALFGQKCIDNTIKLIQHYKPKYFYIENPRSSLMWKYITLNRQDFYKSNEMFINKASYGKYGFLIQKPTNFLSNIKMNLLDGRIAPPYHIETIDGQKYYVLNDDPSVKRSCVSSRIVGLECLNQIIKKRARNCSSGVAGLDFVSINTPNKKELSEVGSKSMIPPKLIQDIFSYFK